MGVYNLLNSNLVCSFPQKAGANPLFSPDGNWLLTGDNSKYCLWNTSTWQKVFSIDRGYVGYTAFMAFSPDSKIAAVTFTRDMVRLIETRTGLELATLEAPEATDIFNLQFNRDGNQLAVLYRSGPVQLWDLRLIRKDLAAMNLDWNTPQ